ncbi:hypothetical protein BH23GEM2_BH23GEM2_20430 [soil metagenome]
MTSTRSVRIRRSRQRRSIPSLAFLLLATACALNCSTDANGLLDPQGALAGKGGGAKAIVVNSTAGLVAALVPENAGKRILLRVGAYGISQPLSVPDGVTLEGEGVMLFDGSGLPTGFAGGTRTTLTMTANVAGNLLTLGDGATIRRLAVEDLAGRSGNAIAVVSRGPGDRISAVISEMEIFNPNAHGQAPAGPTGCGLAAWTDNPNVGMAPPPHEGAAVTVRMTRSLVTSPSPGTGCGVFAFNFAPFGKVDVTLDGNVVGGGIIANGGVSRPDAVHDARVAVESRHNLYRDDSADPCAARHLGWNLTGGSGSLLPAPAPATVRNTLRVQSFEDRIEGFTTGVLARAGLRLTATAGPSSENTVDLTLIGTTVSTPACGGAAFVADFRLAGAQVLNASLVPGDGNTLRVLFRKVTGSGTRANVYTDVLGPSGPQPPSLQGTGNTLEILGSPRAFEQTNDAIDPPPPAEFFTSSGQ